MEEKEVIKSIDQAWQDLLFPNWIIPATTTATTMETANIDPEGFTDTNQFARKSFADVTVLVPFQFGERKA